MKYDDPIRISGAHEKIPDDVNIEQRICEYIKLHHPEYASPSSTVTTRYIKLVDDAMVAIYGIEDPSLESSDEDAEEVLRRLPAEMLLMPVEPKTIAMIIDRLADVRYEFFLEETIEDDDDEAESFNNRANAKMEMGRYNEALEDYNKACELDPDEPGFFINRIFLLIKLGRNDDALNDAMHVFSILEDGIENFSEFKRLALIFGECSRPSLSIACLLRYVRAFKNLISYTEINDNACEIEKDEYHVLMALYNLENVISIVKEIEEENRGDVSLASSIEEIKNEIAILRSFGNF